MSTTATSSAMDFDELTEVAGRVRRAIETVIEGKPDVVEVAITV
ncbi:MAG: MoxR-like ATPase, partial [Kribbellaceae bacterium]|nr:MoxR-like ATPase [Kribbellaceae bacterium]